MLSLWSPSFSPRYGSRPPWLSPPSWSGSLDWRLCSFSFWQERLQRSCQLLSLWRWGHSFLFGRPSMLKFFRWSLRHSARSLLVSAAPTSLQFFFSSSSCLTLVLSSPPCALLHLSSYLKLCDRSGRNCLLFPSALSYYNGSPDTRFSRGTTRPMSWRDGVRYLRPPQSIVIFLLFPLVSTLVLSQTGGVLSHWSSLTHRFPRFPPRNLCSLVILAVSSLVFAATDTAFF